MTDGELHGILEEINREIETLSDPEKPLSRVKRKHGYLLLKKRDALEKILQARESRNPIEEMRHTTNFRLLCSYGEKHPFFLRLLQNKLRWHIF